MDIKEIAKHFVDFYYATFDTNRAGLSSLYVRYDLADISEIKADRVHSRSATPQCCHGKGWTYKELLP